MSIEAIREALEAGPTSAVYTHPRDDNKWTENLAFAEACTPKAILALLQRLDEAEKALQWRPIETAPRGSGEDGPNDTRDPAYIEPPTLLLWTQEGPRVGYYDWYYHPGYGRGADPHESPWRCAEGGKAYGPTHWLPLPPAPKG